MPRFKRREPGIFTAVYYDRRGNVVLSETLRATGLDDAQSQASRALPSGAVRYRVFDEELETCKAASDIQVAMRRMTGRNGGITEIW